MDIKEIKEGKDYYLTNNNCHIRTFTCLKNNGTVILLKIHAEKGFGGGRVSNLNTIECERYVINKK